MYQRIGRLRLISYLEDRLHELDPTALSDQELGRVAARRRSSVQAEIAEELEVENKGDRAYEARCKAFRHKIGQLRQQIHDLQDEWLRISERRPQYRLVSSRDHFDHLRRVSDRVYHCLYLKELVELETRRHELIGEIDRVKAFQGYMFDTCKS